MGFLRFVLARDSLGHPITMNYRDNDNHPTFLGATLTIVIKSMVLIYLLVVVIDMVGM